MKVGELIEALRDANLEDDIGVEVEIEVLNPARNRHELIAQVRELRSVETSRRVNPHVRLITK